MVHQFSYLTSDTCGSEETGVDGAYGLHFKSGSAEEISDKVVRTLLHPEEAVKRANKARARVQAFSIGAMTAKTLHIVDRIWN